MIGSLVACKAGGFAGGTSDYERPAAILNARTREKLGRSFVIAVFESFPPQNRLLCRLALWMSTKLYQSFSFLRPRRHLYNPDKFENASFFLRFGQPSSYITKRPLKRRFRSPKTELSKVVSRVEKFENSG